MRCRFGQLESVTNQLFNLLNKHEHLAAPVAALAAHPALRGDDSRLVGHSQSCQCSHSCSGHSYCVLKSDDMSHAGSYVVAVIVHADACVMHHEKRPERSIAA